MRYEHADPVAATVAFQVYIDICEAKNWLDVQVCHCEGREFTYFTGKEHELAKPEIVIPMSVHASLPMNTLHSFFEELPDPAGGAQPSCFTVAIMESDSTNVYYRLYNGIRAPNERLILPAAATASAAAGGGGGGGGGAAGRGGDGGGRGGRGKGRGGRGGRGNGKGKGRGAGKR